MTGDDHTPVLIALIRQRRLGSKSSAWLWPYAADPRRRWTRSVGGRPAVTSGTGVKPRSLSIDEPTISRQQFVYQWLSLIGCFLVYTADYRTGLTLESDSQ